MTKKFLFTLTAIATFAAAAYADLPEAFHNVPLQDIRHEQESFRSRGVGPRSISLYSFNGNVLGMGIYDRENFGNVATLNVGNSLGEAIDEMAKRGLTAKELTVTMRPSNGVLTFGAIFSKAKFPTQVKYWMKDADFDAAWQEWVVRKGYRIANYITFANLAEQPNTRRHGAIFVKDGKGFFFYHNMTNVQFEARNREMGAKGYLPEDLHIGNNSSGEMYSAVYTKPTNDRVWYYNMIASEYQDTFNEMNAKGYHLTKVMGYRNAERFAAIWEK